MKNFSTLLKRTLLVGLAIYFLSFSLFARICANGSGTGYNGDGTGGESVALNSSGNASIERQVELAGGYFLNANSDIFKLSHHIEMSNINGRNYESWLPVLDNALHNIKQAKSGYGTLIEMAEATSYDYRTISKLWAFDYYGFRCKYSLNNDVFEELVRYLANGDINGVFQRIYNSTVEIEALLLTIRADIVQKKMPILENVWNVNERGVDVLLFSQYAARIFYAIYSE